MILPRPLIFGSFHLAEGERKLISQWSSWLNDTNIDGADRSRLDGEILRCLQELGYPPH